ncbi:hypothetical protein Bca52824_018280 [Brassica carinata]|uniref:FBD domain-containing protein n=1 Tax=Brassica carinata TaxID=52824 RepID=A0A8X8AYE3_BRACI|nr:hypothetical protein Bca52824_018280 [Brassica carinata]
MWLPKLEYNDSSASESSGSLSRFVNLNLSLHKAPVIESLRLNFDVYNRNIVYSIENWVLTAANRCVHELRVTFMHYKLATLPSNLFTCKSLVILELTGKIFVNVPRMVFLPSLKFLILRRMIYSSAKSLQKLLSQCPVLEDLVVERNSEDNNIPFTVSVIVPSLQRLTLKISRGYHLEGLVINTPSLKYFKILDYIEEYKEDSSYSYYFEDTTKLEEADIESTYLDINKFVRSIRSALYHEGIVFGQLQHLKLCSCGPNWSKLLVRLLKDSPLLRDLEVYLNDDYTYSRVDAPVSWQNQLDYVPTCLLASLETFKWTVVYGSHEEIDLGKYILRNACCLKAEEKLEMAKQDLSLSFRGSKTCQLVFV